MTTEVALIVGGGPGISASCARLFSREGMQVAVAARTPGKPVLKQLEREHGVRSYACNAREPEAVAELFRAVTEELGRPRLGAQHRRTDEGHFSQRLSRKPTRA
jgi:NAD(P)-dependent dehydrogenase (short-subunit alcohol dehydrogenase family)